MSPPKFRDDWIEPPALRRGLRLLRDYRFIVISALPGSGKSCFMARLASEAQAALNITAWLRCAPEAGTELVADIAATLVRSVLGERSATAAMLMAPGAVPMSVVLTICLNEVAAFSGDVALFLDDLGNLDTPEAWDMLQALIEQAPDNLRVVMASRSAVRLRLARLANDGALLNLGNRDFQLGSDQIAELIVGLGRPRPDLAELRTLAERTRGWVGGLRLLTRRNSGRRDGASAVSPAVLAYFEEEVLAGLSKATREALDMILLPHMLREDLLVELADGADIRDAIAELQADCLLDARPSRGGVCYQPAPLLTEVVRHLRRIGEDEASRLHRRCSEWFERQGEPQAAAAHAIDAGDTERAVELIDRCGMGMIAHGQVRALQQWMTHLPLDRLRRRPWALLSVAWAVSLLYRLDDAEPLIAAVEEDLALCDAARDRMIEASVAALRVMHLSMRDDMIRACLAAKEWVAQFGRREDWATYVVDNSLSFALAHVGQVSEARLVLERAYLPNFYAQGPYAAIYSRCILGLIDMRDGQVRRAEVNFAWALRAAEADADSNSTGAVMAAGLLAGARHERNELPGARRLLEGYAWWTHDHLFTDARFQAYRAIARDQMRRHQYRAAISTLEQVLDSGPAVRLVRLQADVLAEKLQVAIAQHDLRMADTYLRALADLQLGVSEDAFLHAYLDAGVAGSRACLEMALGAWDSALTRLRGAIRTDLRGGWRLRAFQWAVLLARALWRLDRRTDAIRLMDRLVGYAARAGITGALLDGGPDVARILDAVAARGGEMERRKATHLRRLREAFDPSLTDDEAVAFVSASPAEALTVRELELIRLVKTGLTNREIAVKMQVSENTIKWHLKNIFEKVSVKRRAELAGLALPRTGGAPPAMPPAKRVVSPPRPSATKLSTVRERKLAAERKFGNDPCA